MIWNQYYETMSREKLRNLQSERFLETLKRVYNHVPFYRELLKEHQIQIEYIKGLEDIHKLPFYKKQFFRDQYPYGLFATSLHEIVRLHASSGTTGKPTIVGYTKNDIENWSELVARCLASAGATQDSIIQIAYGYGLFTGGLGIHYGAEKMGVTIIPASGGNTQKQILLMKDLGTTGLACTPSYALYLYEEMVNMGIDPEELNLQFGVFGAEPWSESMRQEIESKLKITAIDIYGLSEAIGPGVAIECEYKNGLHIFEDHFYAEIINPETGEVLPEGEEGELVLTSLTKEAIPIIRYRTGDITSLTYEPCACGRTHVRMNKTKGRTDDMIVVRGVNVFPTQIESVLLSSGMTEPHYQLIVDRVGALDTLEIRVETEENLLEEKEKELKKKILSTIGISAKITLLPPKTLERFEGKAKRLIDLRKK